MTRYPPFGTFPKIHPFWCAHPSLIWRQASWPTHTWDIVQGGQDCGRKMVGPYFMQPSWSWSPISSPEKHSHPKVKNWSFNTWKVSLTLACVVLLFLVSKEHRQNQRTKFILQHQMVIFTKKCSGRPQGAKYDCTGEIWKRSLRNTRELSCCKSGKWAEEKVANGRRIEIKCWRLHQWVSKSVIVHVASWDD